jgi:hypothetical protein
MLLSFSPIASSVPYPQAPLVDVSHCGNGRLGTLVAHPVGSSNPKDQEKGCS